MCRENQKKEDVFVKQHFLYIAETKFSARIWSRWFQIVVGKLIGPSTLCM
jgi:hypothetical protein